MIDHDTEKSPHIGQSRSNAELDDFHAQEAENIMELALGWLMAWDVVNEGKDADPIEVRQQARTVLQDAVVRLALKAQITASPNVELTSRPIDKGESK